MPCYRGMEKNYEIEKKHILICQNESMLNALNLFSGCGGCSLGVQQGGFSVVTRTTPNCPGTKR